MSQRTRMRGLAAWLALSLSLALPLSGSAAEDDDAKDDETQAEAAPPKKDEPAAKAADEDEAEDEATAEEGEEGAAEEEEAVDWSTTHHGIYLIAQGSYSFMTNDSDLEDKAQDAANLGSSSSHVDDSWGYGGRIGYRLMERLALETQVAVLNSIEIHNHQRSDGSNNRSKATFFTAMANAKGYLLTDRIQPYVLGGLGYGYGVLDPPGGSTKDRDSGFVAQFGIGTDFYVTDDLGLMTEVAYVLPTGDVSDYDNVMISFGAMLRFYGGN